MKRIAILFLISLGITNILSQTPDKIIAHADSLTGIGQYEQVIPLLKNKKDILINTDSTDFESYYNLYLGNAYLQIQSFGEAEQYLKTCFTLIENKYGKYSKEYCTYYNLLIKVYDLSYRYENLLNAYLTYIDVLDKVYGKDIPEYSESLNTLGLLCMQLSQYNHAEKYLTEALQRREINFGKEHSNYILTYFNLGLLHVNIGNYDDAYNIFLEIKKIAETSMKNDVGFVAVILMQLGITDLYRGHLDDAEKHLLESKKHLEELNQQNHTAYSAVLRFLGEVYIAKNKYVDAKVALTDAKDLYLKLGNDVKNNAYIAILSDLATVYNSIGDYATAEKYYIEAVNISKENFGTENASYATIINNLGMMYFYTSNYQKAETVLIEAKTIQKKVIGTNHLDYARTLGNLGTLYMTTENFRLAEEYLLESKDIYERTNYKTSLYSLVLNNIGLLYYKLGNSELSTDYFLKSKELTANLLGEESPDYALTLLNLSSILNEWGNDTLALDFAASAAYIFRENFGKKHQNYILALNSIGLIRSKQGIYEKAEDALLASDSLYIQTFGEDYPDRIYPLNNLSVLYVRQKKYDLALNYILEARRLININSRNNSSGIVTLQNIYWIYWYLEQYSSSYQYLNEWNNLFTQSITQNFSFLSAKQREDFLDKNGGLVIEYSIKNLLPVYTTHETQSLAYDNTLFSKGLLLRSSNDIRDAILNSGNQKLISQFEDLQVLRQQITALQAKTDKYEKEYIEVLETRADSLDKAVTVASSAYRDMKADFNLKWKDIQNSLSEDEIAIEFIDYRKFNAEWSDTTLYAALIIRKNFESPLFVPLFEKSQLDLLLSDENNNTEKRINKLYTGGNSRLFNGQKLYQLTWQPLEKYLTDIKTIYYSPSGILNQIAFSAIPYDTVLLNDKYKLNLLSSTRQIVRMKKEKESFASIEQAVEYGGVFYDTDSIALVLSARQYQKEETQYFASRSFTSDSTRSGWDYLKGTEREVVEIENILRKSKIPIVKYMGVSANEESFKALSGHSPELLHIATHGFFLQDEKQIRETGFMQMLDANKNRLYINPLLRSGLLLAGANRAWKNENVISGIEDGILTAEEISQLNLSNTKLVVMSACETGLGETQNSEGVFGLQRAFKLAGVETLVMSLWKVDDNATSKFMISFYQNLMAGKSKMESFETAQQTIRNEYKNPYFWAGFVMMD